MAIDILVVGAGAAGIAAARRLAALGRSCLVLEAGPAAGGRARTDHATFGLPVDLGCHWLHAPAHNPLRGLADRLGHRYEAVAQPLRHAAAGGGWLDDRAVQARGAYHARCRDRIMAAAQAGEDRPVSELLDAPREDAMQASFESDFIAKWGVAPDAASSLDYARYVGEGGDLPVTAGLGTLIGRLAEGLPLRLGAAVTAMRLGSPAGLRADTVAGTVEARAAILTVSTGVLRAEAIRFDPPLPAWKLDAIAGLPMGHCNKIVLAFERQVFDPPDHCLVLPAGAAHEAVELLLRPGGRPVAIALYSGRFGRDLAAAGAAAMAEDCIDRLAALFGAALRARIAPPQLVADWDAAPFVRGYVAAALPGRADARIDLARPVEERLFFAGEAVSTRFMGDLHGAWFSGIAAAEAADRALAAGRGR